MSEEMAIPTYGQGCGEMKESETKSPDPQFVSPRSKKYHTSCVLGDVLYSQRVVLIVTITGTTRYIEYNSESYDIIQ